MGLLEASVAEEFGHKVHTAVWMRQNRSIAAAVAKGAHDSALVRHNVRPLKKAAA